MKIALKFFLKTHDELVDEVMRTQGRDMASYIRKNAVCTVYEGEILFLLLFFIEILVDILKLLHVQWERFIEASMQDAEWRVSGHVPTFDEYIKHAQTTTGLCAVNLITLLLMGPLLPDNILEQIYSPSKFQHLIELTTRLTDDARDFEVFCIEIKIHLQSVYTRWISRYSLPLLNFHFPL
jgi:hypothetical protein